MKLKVLIISMFVMLMTNFSYADELIVTSNIAPLQKGTSDPQVIGLLKAGDVVELKSREEKFFCIDYFGHICYIAKQYCRNTAQSDPKNAVMEKKAYNAPVSGQTVNFWLYTPENISESMPAIIYWHGAGENGKDLDYIKDNVPLCKNLYDKVYGVEAVVIVLESVYVEPGLIEFLDASAQGSITNQNGVPVVIDKSRIAMVGFSNGGYKVWKFAGERPDLVKVAVMMSDNHVASAHLTNLATIDTILAMCGSREQTFFDMEKSVNKINQRAGNAIFHKVDGAQHSTIQNVAFETTKLLDWILEKMN